MTLTILLLFLTPENLKRASGHTPQWQKSEEMMKRLEGSARYLLSSLPYSCSLDSLRAPTSTGTMLNSSLWLFLRNKSTEQNHLSGPRWRFDICTFINILLSMRFASLVKTLWPFHINSYVRAFNSPNCRGMRD